jgi:hypothetical protein
LVIQPTAKHLIVGTHGRSLYKADIAPLQKMNDEIIAKAAHIFAINNYCCPIKIKTTELSA